MYNKNKTGLTLATLAALGLAATMPAMAANPFAGDVAASSYDNGNVFALDPVTGATVGNFITGANATALGGHAVGVAFDSSGNLFATGASGAILEYSAATGAVSTVVAATGIGNNQLAIHDGNIYASNNGTSGTTGQILRYTLAGAPAPASGETGAAFATNPGGIGGGGISFDSAGNLFASNQSNTGPILEVGPSGGVATALTYVAAPNTNGNAKQNNLDSPVGVAVGSNGDVYIAQYWGGDNGTNNILQGVLNGTTLTGTEFIVTVPVNSTPPGHNVGITIDSLGNFYVANTGIGDVLRYTSTGAPFPSAGNTGAIFGPLSGVQAIALAPAAAPEPTQAAVLGIGLLGLGLLAFKARRRDASMKA